MGPEPEMTGFLHFYSIQKQPFEFSCDGIVLEGGELSRVEPLPPVVGPFHEPDGRLQRYRIQRHPWPRL
jgi:hypothetical protein